MLLHITRCTVSMQDGLGLVCSPLHRVPKAYEQHRPSVQFEENKCCQCKKSPDRQPHLHAQHQYVRTNLTTTTPSRQQSVHSVPGGYISPAPSDYLFECGSGVRASKVATTLECKSPIPAATFKQPNIFRDRMH